MWSNELYPDQSNGQVGAAAQPVGPSAFAPGQAAPLVPAYPSYVQQPAQPQYAPVPRGLPQGAFDIPTTLAERIELCKLLADSDLVSRALQGKPANLLLIMHKALALDLPLMVAIEHLHVIDGKVGHSAELLRAKIAGAGHVLRWTSITDQAVTGELILRHDPKNPRRETFTIADATRMKLTTKDNWTKDPASMLVARVTTRLVSRHCPEIAVALGNLSAIDFEEAPETPAAPEGPTPEERAAELLSKAGKATTSTTLSAFGKQAREDGLLDVVVGDKTLQAHLLARINEIAEDRKAEADKADKQKADKA